MLYIVITYIHWSGTTNKDRFITTKKNEDVMEAFFKLHEDDTDRPVITEIYEKKLGDIVSL